jgi:hypothetical protein
MYTISLWASRHLWYARILIVVGFLLLTELALFIGSTLQLLQVSLPMSFFYAAIAVFLAVFLLYPYKKYGHWFANSYRYQKTCDSVLLVTTFVLLTYVGNRPEAVLQLTTAQATAAVPNTIPAVHPTIKNGAERMQSVLQKVSKKALKQGLYKKVKQLRKAYKKTSNGGKIGLIVLTVVIAFLLLSAIAALSCSISCSGAEGLAIAILLVGSALVVFFFVRMVRRIIKGPKKKPDETPALTEA